MKEKDFLGKMVVSMSDSAKVGTVKDLLFHGLDLTALVVNGERGEGLLPFASVSKNGDDAITIESYALVDWNAGRALDPESRYGHDFQKLSVIDSTGTKLGHVHDFSMNEKGQMDSIEVRTEGVFGLGGRETIVPGARIHAIGADMITVEAAS